MMRSISRRSFLALGALSGLALSGCSDGDVQGQEDASDASETVDEDEEEVESVDDAPEDDAGGSTGSEVGLGEAVEVSTEYGDVTVAVEGFASDTAINDQYSDYLGEGMVIGMLLALVENVSYDRYGDSDVNLEDDMRVEDQDGVSINDFGLSPSFNEYEGYPGRYFECQIGEKRRVAMCFEMPVTTQSVTAVFGDVRVPIEIELS